MLRDYQRRAIDQLYEWLRGNDGDPVLVLPTGSGKSHIVAALCREAVHSWPQTRILMCSHVKELVEQNAEKMRQHWPNAPLGVYSAGMRSRDIDQITFASIQSLRGKVQRIGWRDLFIVDECHTINNKAQGQYRELIAQLREINPDMRVIGLTATPYRLGQGMLTEGDNAIFSGIVEAVTIRELVDAGHLAPLKSKHTEAMIDTSQIKKRGGEYIAAQANAAADEITQAAVAEIVRRADDRKHWLVFCSGVDHSYHVRDELRSYGITSETVTGKTPTGERARIINDFKNGRIQALTNADVLTTGFDAPDTDLIAFLRPTMSAGLYVQMAGRGMRLKRHTDHCLVLDFAGNVETHGPITGIVPPKAAGEGGGEAPVKVCPECAELLPTSIMKCYECGYIFPPNPKPLKLSNADIMGIEPQELTVTDWRWQEYTSKAGNDMVMVRYYGNLTGPVIPEYLAIKQRAQALATLHRMAEKGGLDVREAPLDDMKALANWMNAGKPPSMIQYRKNGRFYDIDDRVW